MYNFTTNQSITQRLELIQELNKLLETATQAAGQPIGIESVTALLQYSGISPTLSSTGIDDILNAVKEAGISLTPGLIKEIDESNPEIVRHALAIYLKSYGEEEVTNPSGLFYTILKNQKQRIS